MTNIFAAALVALGSFLEVFYYVARFLSDGAPAWLAVIEGLALNLLLQVVVFFGKSRARGWFALAAVLGFYSVFCTAAGQQAGHADVQAATTADATREAGKEKEIAETESRIAAIDTEYAAIVIPTDIETRARYRTTVAAAESRKRELEAERKTYAARLAELRATATGSTSITRDSYSWYAGLFGGDPRVWQLIAQLVLSVLVAIMAPVGVLAWRAPVAKPEPVKVVVAPKPKAGPRQGELL